MRRRTKKLPSNRALIYLVLILLLAGARYIYDNYVVPNDIQQGATTLVLSTSETAEDEATPDESNTPAPAKKKARAKYSGWAELPAEIDDSDLYYAYHTITTTQLYNLLQSRVMLPCVDSCTVAPFIQG